MKKLLVLSIMISLFTFLGSKNEVNIVNAEEVVPQIGVTSVTFSNDYNDSIYFVLENYQQGLVSNIVSIKFSNSNSDLPSEYIGKVAIPNCTYTDKNGNSSIPQDGVVFAYLSKSSKSTKKYDCVIYSNIDVFYTSEDASAMFSSFSSLETIDMKLLDTSKSKYLSYFFWGCNNLKSVDVSNMNTSNAIAMDYMFSNCESLTELDLSNFDTSNVTNMSYMFGANYGNGLSLTNINIDNFDTRNVTNMEGMFYDCSLLAELNLSNFDTTNVENMKSMFHGCSSLSKMDLSNFDMSSIKNMEGMFHSCSKLSSIDMSNKDYSKANMALLFSECKSLVNVDFSNAKLGINTYGMFSICPQLTSINFSNTDTSNTTDMGSMFSGCSSLTTIDFLSNFDTSNVTNMVQMFRDCSSLIELDFTKYPNFKTNNVSGINCMYGMFSGCSSLTKLDISSFDLTKCLSSFGDFLSNCTNLQYFKSPKALPAKSSTDSNYAITLPPQLVDYYGVATLTCDNLAKYKAFCIPGDEFINNWKALREEGGENGICAAISSSSIGNAKLNQLLTEYDAFDEDYKEYVNKATDKEGVTVGESVTYVKNVLSGTQATEKDYGINKEDFGSYMTMSINEKFTYIIAIISMLGILAVLGYYFYNKKRQEM